MASNSNSEEALDEQFWVLPLPKFNRSSVKVADFEQLGQKQTVEDVEYGGKRVLVRVDYNVPMSKGKITDTARVDATLPTLRYLLDPARARPRCLVLVCHMGRPGGKFEREDFSLRPVADLLQERLGQLAKVRFVPECVGPDVEREIDSAPAGECTVFLLENLRFHVEETGSGITARGKKIKADPDAVKRFRDALTRLGDIFVMEAFGAAHRPHSSVVGVGLPHRVAGLLLKRELDVFAGALGKPQRPFVAILGGAKITDKLPVIKNLLGLVDEIVIGGGMAFTFKKLIGDGIEIGKSLFDEEGAGAVDEVMRLAAERGVKVHLPVDYVAADRFDPGADTRVVTDAEGIPADWMGLDCGPATRALNRDVIMRAKTVIWNGPLGVFEFAAFSGGTESAMQDMARATQRGTTTIIGGGDTGAASAKFMHEGRPVAEQVTHVSTGGGSTLVLLEGTELPGITHLSDKAPDNISLKDMWEEVRRLRDEVAELRAAVGSGNK